MPGDEAIAAIRMMTLLDPSPTPFFALAVATDAQSMRVNGYDESIIRDKEICKSIYIDCHRIHNCQ
jgi:hypothetical protein